MPILQNWMPSRKLNAGGRLSGIHVGAETQINCKVRKAVMRTSVSIRHSVKGVFCLLLALMCASCVTRVDSSSGADLDKFTNVCMTGTPGQVQAMIDGGADVNMRGHYGYTPLIWAA